MCSGEYFDEETGLIYLRNRYYDASTGRFITEDPIRDGLNWYVYCGNNPVMFVDPWGLVVTAWDENNLSSDDLEKIKENDRLWNSGDEYQKQMATASSRQIREKYLKENQTILDNGYVEETIQKNISSSIFQGEVVINSSIGIQRIYTEDDIYVRLCNVDIKSYTATPRTSISELYLHIGQSSKASPTQKHTERVYDNTYSYSPNWGWVLDVDTEGYEVPVGVVIEANIKRGTATHNVIINNQLYSNDLFINGHIQINKISEFDVLRDIIQDIKIPKSSR
ncbi:MAG: RHS repeat-associated core domain-containing protein [Clostridia bacterium]|nr:RHS repeat-associated core domain-containing protein [Clostridia bacterium]